MNDNFIYRAYIKITSNLPEILLFAVLGLIQISRMNMDFWNDEIYTIQHFVLTSVKNTVSNYHAPNNHIFFNLISNFYLKIIGIDSLHTLFESPWKLRIVPLIYSFFTAYFTYKIGSKYINRTVGLLALIILITTVPYYNFSLQIRGYPLSIMLSVAVIYNLLFYFFSLKQKELIKLGFLACFLFYTIPSNLYFLLSIIIALGVYIIFYRNNIGKLLSNKYAYSIYAITAGILLAMLFYLPVMGEVFSNKYVRLGNHFNLPGLKYSVFSVARGLVTNRWLIILLSIAGFIAGYKYWMKEKLMLLLVISVTIVPLLIIWVSGQQAPARIFTLCLPFVSLFMAISIFAGWNKFFPIDRKNDWILISCLFLFTIISLFLQFNKVEKKILADIHNGTRSQNMYYQYYSARYWPLRNLKSFKSIYNKNKLPVVIAGCEPHGIPNYLEKFNIPFTQNNLDSILIYNDSVYLVTNHPFKFVERNDIDTKILNTNLSYHNSLIIRKK